MTKTYDAFLKTLSTHKIQLTSARRLIARLLCESDDHPDVSMLHARARKEDASVSLATVYRTLGLFHELGLLEKHQFRGSDMARYETSFEKKHAHIVDINAQKVVEFHDKNLESTFQEIAHKFGFHLLDYKLELYGSSLEKK